MGVGCVCICNGSERLRRRALAGPCPSALLSLDYSCRSLCRLVWPRAGLALISLLPYVLLWYREASPLASCWRTIAPPPPPSSPCSPMTFRTLPASGAGPSSAARTSAPSAAASSSPPASTSPFPTGSPRAGVSFRTTTTRTRPLLTSSPTSRSAIPNAPNSTTPCSSGRVSLRTRSCASLTSRASTSLATVPPSSTSS